MNHKIQAITNFEKGYNCAQAVACAYADDLGIDEELLFRLTEGFGGGFTHMGYMCGTLSGLTIVESYRKCRDMKHMPNGKLETYAHIQPIIQAFQKEIKAVNCKDILEKGDQTLINGKKKCCRSCVMMACDLLDHPWIEN